MVNNDNLMLQNRAKGANYVSSAFFGKCVKIMPVPVPEIMLAQSINAFSRQRLCPFQLSLFVSAFYFRPNQLLESLSFTYTANGKRQIEVESFSKWKISR